MTQRDTINPVCRVVNVAANTTTSVTLRKTANQVTSITTLGNSDGSGYTDYARFTVSAVPNSGWGTNQVGQASAYIAASATGYIRVGDFGSYTGVPSAVHIENGGAYGFVSGSMGLSSLHSQNAAGVPGAVAGHVSGATFAVVLGPPTFEPTYVTVTDASGAGAGFFRVTPGSGTDYYLSAGGNMGLLTNLSLSGVPGVLGGAGDTVTLTLQPGQAQSDINIENRLIKSDQVTGSAFLITYGMVKSSNPRRDQDAPDIQ